MVRCSKLAGSVAGSFAVLLSAITAEAAHVTVRLVAERTAVAPNGMVTVAAVFTIEPGWHLYWTNPGDTGTPPKIKWTLPAGVTAGPTRFPVPQRLNIDGLTAYGYQNEVTLMTDVSVPAAATGSVELTGRASWVVCADACVLEKADVRLTLPMAAGPGSEDAAFVGWRATQPARPADAVPLVAAVDADGRHGSIDFPLAAGVDGVEFFPPAAAFAVYEPPRVVTVDGHRVYRASFRMLPDPPAAHAGTAVVVTKSADGKRSAVELPVNFKFASPSSPG